MKRTEFIEELKALARDVKAICLEHKTCYNCVLWSEGLGCLANFNGRYFNVGKVMAAVENYRNRSNPRAEVIDKARDIYLYEVQIERTGSALNNDIAQKGVAFTARHRANLIEKDYREGLCTVTVLSAKRFALESHREDE